MTHSAAVRRDNRCTLTPENVIDIYHSRDSIQTLAWRYGVTKERISGIQTGRAWPHVTAGMPRAATRPPWAQYLKRTVGRKWGGGV